MNGFYELAERLSRRFTAVPAVICFVAILLSYLISSWAGVVIVLVITVGLLVFTGTKRRAGKALMITIGLLVIILVSMLMSVGTMRPEDGGIYEFDARVVSAERRLDGKTSVVISTREFGKLNLMLFENSPYIPDTGSTIHVKGRITYPGKGRNPGEFDSESYLRRMGISYELKTLHMEELRGAGPLRQMLNKADEYMFAVRDKITDLFGDQKPLAAAIFLGDTSLTDKSVSSLFRRMGCSHLLAVSGTHFSGFLMILAMMSDSTREKKKHEKTVFVLFCLVIGSLAGWSRSVTRAAFMSSGTCCSKDSLSGMCLAALVMMVADPYSALSYGFLMSFFSCLSILVVSPRLSYRLRRFGMHKAVAETAAVIISSQIGMLPFGEMTSLRYGVIPFAVQIISTLIAQTACVFFVPSVILALIFNNIFIEPAKLMIVILRDFIELASRIYSAFRLTPLTAVCIIVAVIFILTPRSVIRKRLVIPLLIITAITFGSTVTDLLDSVSAQVIFIDVGQGDSCLIISGGKSLLIDGGTYKAGQEHVTSVLDYYGIDVVDIAIATHLDEDHYGGIRYLNEVGRIAQTVTPYPEDGMTSVFAGDSIELSSSCAVRILAPSPDLLSGDPNEDSVVALVDAAGLRILMTGDIGSDTEARLVNSGIIPDVDVLKVAHHGSGFSTSDIFLDAASPEISVISVAAQNEYGHPAPDTVERLDKHNSDIYMTSRCGAIIFTIRDHSCTTNFYAS